MKCYIHRPQPQIKTHEKWHSIPNSLFSLILLRTATGTLIRINKITRKLDNIIKNGFIYQSNDLTKSNHEFLHVFPPFQIQNQGGSLRHIWFISKQYFVTHSLNTKITFALYRSIARNVDKLTIISIDDF